MLSLASENVLKIHGVCLSATCCGSEKGWMDSRKRAGWTQESSEDVPEARLRGGKNGIEEKQLRWGPFGGCNAIACGTATSGHQDISALQAASPAGSGQCSCTARTGSGAERGAECGASHPTTAPQSC